jgi:arylsulfatase
MLEKFMRSKQFSITFQLLIATFSLYANAATEMNNTSNGDEDRPNIVVIIADDVAFGAPSTFGGTIPTTAFDRVAAMGIRYSNFHSAPLSQETRAALITGRNQPLEHQRLGTGRTALQEAGELIIPQDCATLGVLLKQQGYATAWIGKNVNTPQSPGSSDGSFDYWPRSYGFDHFYGFIGNHTSQWQPNLLCDYTPIQPYLQQPHWNLTTAMAEDAIQFINAVDRGNPNQRFFLYYAATGVGSPHHPTAEWMAKFAGKFDHGWNVERERIFANQKQLGLVAANAEPSGWPDFIPRWETLSDDCRKLFARQAEAYAAFLAYTDHEIGRVIQAIDAIGKLDNTLIVYISGDCGFKGDTSLFGTPNAIAESNGVMLPVREQLKFYDLWGSDKTYPQMSLGWAWAFDTPFQQQQPNMAHINTTRQGMAIAWPKGISDKGSWRPQFHHVVDIMPTLLDAAKITLPASVNGVAQRPIDGTSMSYSWSANNAHNVSTHPHHLFQMVGNCALYCDGWVASTTVPLQLGNPATQAIAERDKDDYGWTLYNISNDPLQNSNIAEAFPQKLKAMQQLFIAELGSHTLKPAKSSIPPSAPLQPATDTPQSYIYNGQSGHALASAPNLLNKSYRITAEIELPSSTTEGILITQGGHFGGYAFYLLKGHPVFVWNICNLERVRWEGKTALAPGRHTLLFDFEYDGGRAGNGGTGTLCIDGEEVAFQRMERTIPCALQWNETFDIGLDSGTSVEERDYSVPFTFEGTINKITIEPR